MKVAFRMVMAAALASLVSLTASCADGGGPASLTGPEDGATVARSTDKALEHPSLERLARFRVKPQVRIAWAKKWIGPAGGRLEFEGFAVDVPAGAVSKVTQFSIRLPVDPKGSEHVLAEFGPHGSTFRVPVTIEFPYRGTSIETSSDATVVWWSGNRDGWVDIGGTPTADGLRLRATTTHFSTYGTATQDRAGGTMTTSGG